MSESIHGHQVMEMMIALGKAVKKEELKALMHEKFGGSAQYHTCSVAQMDAESLIDFLESKGKFVQSDEGVQTDIDRICSH